MAMSVTKLAVVFKGSAATEQEAIDHIANAFHAFFLDTTVNAAPAVEAALVTAGAEADLRAALVGLSSSGGFTKLQTAITAYWAAAMAAAPLVWVTAPLISTGAVPAGLTGLTAAIVSTSGANSLVGVTIEQAANNIAAAVLPTMAGAVVVLLPVPPGTPGVVL